MLIATSCDTDAPHQLHDMNTNQIHKHFLHFSDSKYIFCIKFRIKFRIFQILGWANIVPHQLLLLLVQITAKSNIQQLWLCYVEVFVIIIHLHFAGFAFCE